MSPLIMPHGLDEQLESLAGDVADAIGGFRPRGAALRLLLKKILNRLDQVDSDARAILNRHPHSRER